MRQLLPEPRPEVAPYEVYRPEAPHAALLRLNMVASVDGRITDAHGRTAGLGDAADLAVFRALRALADGILVGAATARIEGYGPHRLHASVAQRRRDDGRPRPAPIVVVSRSLELDYDSPLFTEAETPTVVLTCAAAPADRLARARLAGVVVVAGETKVDLTVGVERLREQHGLVHLLCEGGPILNGELLEEGLLDELCLTVAPSLAGTQVRALTPVLTRGHDLDLLSLCEQDGSLFARYGVRRASDHARARLAADIRRV